MKALALALAIVAAPIAAAPLAGCQTLGLSATADEKAIILVERTFAGTLVAINAGVDSGAIRGEKATQAIRLLADAKARVNQARALYDAGQAAQAVSAANSAQNTLEALAAIK